MCTVVFIQNLAVVILVVVCIQWIRIPDSRSHTSNKSSFNAKPYNHNIYLSNLGLKPKLCVQSCLSSSISNFKFSGPVLVNI